MEFCTIGENRICPYCEKQFTVTEETMFYSKDWVCSWECFLHSLKSSTLKDDVVSNKTIKEEHKSPVQTVTEGVSAVKPTKKNLWEVNNTTKRKRGRPRKV